MHEFGCTEISGLRHVVATGMLKEAERELCGARVGILQRTSSKNVGEREIWYGKHECDGMLMVLWLNN